MLDELVNLLQLARNVLPDFVTWPGEYLLLQAGSIAPGPAQALGLAPGNQALVYSLSLLSWLVMLQAIRSVRTLFSVVAGLARRLLEFTRFRLSLTIGSWRRRLALVMQTLLFWRPEEQTEIPHLEFSDQDIAVLDTIAARGPGFTISAPELTERLELTPAQVQRALSRLCDGSLLQPAIGSTDGFDNYRVTAAGRAFLDNWLRQTSPNQLSHRMRRITTPEAHYIPDGLHLRG